MKNCKSIDVNYMTTHLVEAIALNCRRLPKYAKLSKGRSTVVSILLICSETAGLSTSLFMDFIAKKWQRKGVPVLVHEFITMQHTPPFEATYSFDIKPLDSLPKIPSSNKVIKKSIQIADYAKLSLALESTLVELEAYPHVLCMQRHVYESMLRCSNLLPMHMVAAQRANLKSPENFCRSLLWSHYLTLGLAKLIDKVAFPIQNAGVPIVYQDVPVIPPLPEKY